MTKKIANPLGIANPFNHVSKGDTIMAINTANKKGTKKGAAIFIPATTMTKAAVTTKKLEKGDVFSLMGFPVTEQF